VGGVTDPSGAFITNAQVTATNIGTHFSRTVQTNGEGEYRLDFLPIGSYTVEFSAPGFKKSIRNDIVLTVNVTTRVDSKLEVGPTSDTVTVETAAPLLNTSNAQIGRSVDNAEITTLPLVNRNVYSLLTLTPGVTSSQNSITLGFPEQRTQINGGVDAAIGSVNYYLDGGNNMTGLRNTGNVAPNPDAVQEFRITTNNYSAEYGRFAGGVISIVTKSGTNDFHGSVFEFLRNTDLNAYTWGALSASPLHRNQYGASVGGPVRKDKTFFFGSWSGLRQIQTNFMNTAVVPTALERAGNFSSSKPVPNDPLSKSPFPGNVIPANRLDPTAMNILNRYIPAQANSSGNVFQGQVPSPYNSDEFLAKVDHTLTPNQVVTFSYFETSGSNKFTPTNTNLPTWSVQQFNWRQHNANASDTWTFSPNAVNQFWATYTRNFGGRLNLPQTSLGDLGSQFRIQGTPSLPQIAVTGYFTLGQAIAGPVAGSNFYSMRDMVSYTRGKHTLKFGGELSLNKDVQQTLLNNYGVFSFTNAKTGNALADFMLGLPATMNQDAPVTALDNFWVAGLFLQDDYRVSRRLTLNLGLRYELQTAPTDPFDREATFKAGVQSTVLPTAPTGLLVVGDPGVGRGIVPTPKAHFSPRIGIAWDPMGDGKMSVRAGAGLFWGSVSGNEWNAASNFQPFAVRQQFNNVTSLTNPYGALPGGLSPFPYTYDPKSPRFIYPTQLLGIAPDFKWPHTYQLNFSVQRQIAKDFAVTAAYVGAMARHLTFGVDLNYPLFSPTATAANVNDRRPMLPGVLGPVYSKGPNMTSNYHSLQITVEKRMSRRFGLKGFYVWSKGVSGGVMEGATDNALVEDFRNMKLDHARLDNDRKHVSVTSLVWNVDYFSKPLAHRLIDGWQLSAIVTLQSGLPFTVTAGRDVNLDGNNNDRGNLVGNPFLDPNRSRTETTAAWFNVAAFQIGANGTDGNAGRNILDGPGVKNVDLGLFRNFKLFERVSLQARGEFTNVFNFVNLSNPTANLGSALVGQIRSAGAMRQLQVGLRLTF
jgi:hypothetical protein